MMLDIQNIPFQFAPRLELLPSMNGAAHRPQYDVVGAFDRVPDAGEIRLRLSQLLTIAPENDGLLITDVPLAGVGVHMALVIPISGNGGPAEFPRKEAP